MARWTSSWSRGGDLRQVEPQGTDSIRPAFPAIPALPGGPSPHSDHQTQRDNWNAIRTWVNVGTDGSDFLPSPERTPNNLPNVLGHPTLTQLTIHLTLYSLTLTSDESNSGCRGYAAELLHAAMLLLCWNYSTFRTSYYTKWETRLVADSQPHWISAKRHVPPFAHPLNISISPLAARSSAGSLKRLPKTDAQ